MVGGELDLVAIFRQRGMACHDAGIAYWRVLGRLGWAALIDDRDRRSSSMKVTLTDGADNLSVLMMSPPALPLRPVKYSSAGLCFPSCARVSVPKPAVPGVLLDTCCPEVIQGYDVPPVMRITLPDRSPMSLLGLQVSCGILQIKRGQGLRK